MEAVRIGIVGCLVVDQYRLIRRSQPEPVAAIIRLVVAIDVARCPGFESIIVGVRAIVSFEDVAGARPAVEHSDKNPITTMSAVIINKMIVIGSTLDQHTCRVPVCSRR